jgi:hypothetical protein
MTEKEIIRRLKGLEQWGPALRLEPFELLVNQAPAGALDDVHPYMLTDDEYRPARNAPGRPWRPLLVAGDDLLLDPSTEMLDRFLDASGYWRQPDAFGDQLLLQFHRFALDFYRGYQVREGQFERSPDHLTIRGQATRGGPSSLSSVTFVTRVGRQEPAAFTVTPLADDELMG